MSEALDLVEQSPYIPQAPTRRQALFLALPVREALYGGAAGGGKSSALLMAALMYADTPGYAALLLRRTYTDLALPGALMSRSHEWLSGSDASWSDRERTWTFPSGATLSFGYLAEANDRYRYQGSEFSFLGWDELTQFTRDDYSYLHHRLRRGASSRVPLRMRAATNPGGRGHEWVRQHFLVEGPHAIDERTGLRTPRLYVPARLDDNPHVDRETYETSLAQLDAVTRAQLRDGNWDVRPPGQMFRREWWHVEEAAPIGVFKAAVRHWDLAATAATPGTDPDWTAGTLLARADDGRFWILDQTAIRETPGAVERAVRATAERDGREVAVVIEQEPGAAGKMTVQRFAGLLAGWNVHGLRPSGPKASRAAALAAQAEAGNVVLLRGPWITAWMDEAEAFPSGAHDDRVDSASGALAWLTRRGGQARYVPDLWA